MIEFLLVVVLAIAILVILNLQSRLAIYSSLCAEMANDIYSLQKKVGHIENAGFISKTYCHQLINQAMRYHAKKD